MALIGLEAIVNGQHRAAFVGLGVAARQDGGLPHRRQPACDVDVDVRIGVGARAVVERDRLAIGQRDLAHGHAHAGVAAFDVDLARSRQGLACQAGAFVQGLGGGQGRGGSDVWGVHDRLSSVWMQVPRPMAMGHVLRGAPSGRKGSGSEGGWPVGDAARRRRHRAGRLHHGPLHEAARRDSSSFAGMNRIKFNGFGVSPSQRLRDRITRHTPERCEV